MGIGIDIVRMARFAGKEKLAPRILSLEELAIYQQRSNKVEFIAGRFAAKEAFFKALKKGIGHIPFTAVSIIYDSHGAPILIHDNNRYEVSISHDGDYAIAIVKVDK